ncbi:uncharacterized protein C8Q71DRAFT_809474 [Rhodofomes roseus]|uniref:Large ribosomal subunit protein mL40 n=1 Tax=Rhodofomes roseus TaxID=34475 RepID=A0A4Y9Z247_9APHY|nr:uncharacterized protein C8Q71DRAFT_809474 [Rhodofomes roseus]KAH9837300.1 hypothetical protein C8Q71DRAFT_809474 [Rhodofomes roseus]TFY68582.1 hypothetical protein EVJ58_g908 [Rhodofomes roseus]
MSFALRAVREATPPLRVAQSSVRYARKDAGPDPRVEHIRRALYPGNIRNKETPIGSWRPNVGGRLQRAIPSVQAHETIERAWFLHQRHVRKRREAELERKHRFMVRAMEVLHELDPKLYKQANQEEDPRVRRPEEIELAKTLKAPEKRALESRIRGLFPRELRVPTDTPPRSGWNYDWKPPFPRV